VKIAKGKEKKPVFTVRVKERENVLIVMEKA
jgi:hypothetical protein